MWIVGLIHKWKDAFEMDRSKPYVLPFPVTFDCDSIGFCEVFDDYDKALAAAGGDKAKVWGVVVEANKAKGG